MIMPDRSPVRRAARWLSSSRYTPVGPDSIPTSMARPVAGSPFDFTAEKAIGRDINADDQQLRNVGGYDHVWGAFSQTDGRFRAHTRENLYSVE